MKKALIGIAVVLVLLVGAALVIPQFIDLNDYRSEISEQAHAATGRTLTIGGDIHLSLLPSLELAVSDVAFANAPGAEPAEMATLTELQLKLKLFPLLSGAIEIDKFVLVDPVINLQVDAEGHANWVFDTGASAPAEDSGEAGDAPALGNLKLDDIRIENGRVAYVDDVAGTTYSMTEINMALHLPDLASPFSADGSLIYEGQAIAVAASIDTPAKLLAGERTNVALEIDSAPVSFTFDGGVVNGPQPKVDGNLEIAIPSIRELAAWAGSPIEVPGSGLGPFRAAGALAVDGKRYAISDGKILLDDISSTGSLLIDLNGTVPAITAELATGPLVLDPYLPKPASTAPQETVQSSDPAEPADWSDEVVDVSPLGLANAELTFSAEAIRYQEFDIGKSVLEVHLKDSDLVVYLREMALYEGNGTARIQLDARDGTPKTFKSVRVDSVQFEPLLSAAADFDRLSGTGHLEIEVSGEGRSEREIVSSLNGQGRIQVLDGTINGINLAAMVRNVATAVTAQV